MIFLPVVLAFVVGVIGAFAVQGFLTFVGYFAEILRSDNSQFLGFPPEILIISAPVIAGLIVGMLLKVSGFPRWHGPPDSILAAHAPEARPNTEAGLLSTLASAISLAGGASVGQYGPLVHFGGVIGDYISKLTRDQVHPHILLASGAAAAISAGFGAPIAGLIFAHEVILRHMAIKAFAPILVASVTAHTVRQTYWSSEPMFLTNLGGIEALYELPALAVLGIVCGLIATIYMRGLTGSFPIPSKLPLVIRPAIAGLICGIVGLFVPQVLGLGVEPIRDMIAGEGYFSLWILLLCSKLILTVICIRMNLFGGIFSPALFIGVATGCLVASIFALILPDTNPSLFAVAGLAAVTASVIGGPISTILIVFELTSDYQVALGAGVSVVFSMLVSGKIYGHSAFDQILLTRNIDIHKGRNLLRMSAIKIEDLTHSDFIRVAPEHTINQMIKILSSSGFSEGYILDSKGKLKGKVLLSELVNESNKSKPPKKQLTENYLSLKMGSNLLEAIEKISQFIGESVPVVDKESGKILGIVTESDLFNALLAAERARNSEELDDE